MKKSFKKSLFFFLVAFPCVLFGDITGLITIPGGNNGESQYGNNFVFEGSSYVVYSTSTGRLTTLTLPQGSASSLAAYCSSATHVGRIMLSTNSTSGQWVYVCESSGSWVLQGDGGGSGTPGGSTTQFQYNDAGSFAGSSIFTQPATDQVNFNSISSTTFVGVSTMSFGNNVDILLSSGTRFAMDNYLGTPSGRAVGILFSNASAPSGPFDTRQAVMNVVMPDDDGGTYALNTFSITTSTGIGASGGAGLTLYNNTFGGQNATALLVAGTSNYISVGPTNSEVGYSLLATRNRFSATPTSVQMQTLDTSTASVLSYTVPGRLRFYDGDSSAGVILKSSQTVASEFSLVLPPALPASNGLSLVGDTNGDLYFASVAGSGGDNLGNHIATKTITAGFGISATTATYSGAVGIGGGTIGATPLLNMGARAISNIGTSSSSFDSSGNLTIGSASAGLSREIVFTMGSSLYEMGILNGDWFFEGGSGGVLASVVETGVVGPGSGSGGAVVIGSGTISVPSGVQLQVFNGVTIGTPTYGGSSPNNGIAVGGHIQFKSTSPTVSSCGTGPSVAGNDSVGAITVGTGGVATSCTLTFRETWTNAPTCNAWHEGAILLVRPVTTTTTLVIDAATPLTASGVIRYSCLGYQ